MEYCSHCGKEIQENANFCSSCGVNLKSEKRADSENEKNFFRAATVVMACSIPFMWRASICHRHIMPPPIPHVPHIPPVPPRHW